MFFKTTEIIKNEETPEKKHLRLMRGNERVMVIDDEKGLLLLTQQVLEKYGYKVCPYSNSLQALDDFKKQPDHFDLIITDMTMPKITGMDLSIEVLKIRSDLPIILCTGYSENISEIKALEIGIKQYFQKPVDTRHLMKAVRKILDKSKFDR